MLLLMDVALTPESKALISAINAITLLALVVVP